MSDGLKTTTTFHFPRDNLGSVTRALPRVTALVTFLVLPPFFAVTTALPVALPASPVTLARITPRRFVVGNFLTFTVVVEATSASPRAAQSIATSDSIVQISVIAVLCSIATVPDGVVLPSTRADWASVVYMALVAGAAAMQAHLPPTRSAIIMSMEPVFAATFAVWLGGEPTTLRMVGGGLMVLTAMLLVELAPRRKVEGEVQHLVV